MVLLRIVVVIETGDAAIEDDSDLGPSPAQTMADIIIKKKRTMRLWASHLKILSIFSLFLGGVQYEEFYIPGNEDQSLLTAIKNSKIGREKGLLLIGQNFKTNHFQRIQIKRGSVCYIHGYILVVMVTLLKADK